MADAVTQTEDECDFIKNGDRYVCRFCGHVASKRFGRPPRRVCSVVHDEAQKYMAPSHESQCVGDHGKQTLAQKAAERLGLAWTIGRRYGRALANWSEAGFPTRGKLETDLIFEKCCKPCENFNGHGCGICKCRTNQSGLAIVNKLKMATEACPLGKFNVWEPHDEPLTFVYPYLAKAAIGNELLYSVRSVEEHYLGEADIWIIGDRPAWWTRDDRFINCPRVRGGARIDCAHKLRVICETDAIPEVFIKMMDDVYFMKPVDFGFLNTPWTSAKDMTAKRLAKSGRGKGFGRQKRTTFRALLAAGRPMREHAAHMPVVYEKSKVLEMLNTFGMSRAPFVDDLLFLNYFAPSRFKKSQRVSTRLCRVTAKLTDAQLGGKLDPAVIHNHLSGCYRGAVERNLRRTFTRPSSWESPDTGIREVETTPEHCSTATLDNTHDASTMALWSLWEGPKPAYIELCQETLRKTNPSVRILSMSEFCKLQNTDGGVDVSHLAIANQSDWVRLYLLRHFGGLWIDADCIVFRPLDRFIDALRCCWSMTYYEVSKHIGGGFMGAPPNSPHIVAMYDRARAVVKSKKKIGWREILGDNMEAVLAEQGWQGFLKLDWRHFIPVRPHRPTGELFIRGTDEQHERRFSEIAYTYMLSHNSFQTHVTHMTRDELLGGDLFLSYLFRRALGKT